MMMMQDMFKCRRRRVGIKMFNAFVGTKPRVESSSIGYKKCNSLTASSQLPKFPGGPGTCIAKFEMAKGLKA
jgi:hypothetical protein